MRLCATAVQHTRPAPVARWATVALAIALAVGAAASLALAASALEAQPRPDVIFDGPPVPPLLLSLPSSAVAGGLANIGLLSREADVLFYNPAMLTYASGIAGTWSHFSGRQLNIPGNSIQTPSLSVGAAATVQTLGAYSVGLGARATGEDNAEFAITAGVARAIGPVRVGVSGSFLNAPQPGMTERSFDVGAAMPLGPAQLALSVQHLGAESGSGFVDADRPWQVALGYGNRPIPVSTFVDLNVLTQLTLNSQGTVFPAGAGEVIYVPIEGVSVIGRLGIRREQIPGEGMLTTGFSLGLDRFALNYATDLAGDFPRVHRIGIRFR